MHSPQFQLIIRNEIRKRQEDKYLKKQIRKYKFDSDFEKKRIQFNTLLDQKK